jgi:formylglycine-generating enzyme required for sulfatase activity
LGRLLADHRSLRLALLNACEGARGSERDVFSSTATILVRRGIPAVLAMQYEVTDRAAIEVARAFYEALADGWSVDAAVAEARKAVSLAVANTVEWGTPVLCMRSPDGLLFNVQEREATDAIRTDVEHKARSRARQVGRKKERPALVPSPQPFEPELILIPAGEFLMGSDPQKDKDAPEEEQPQHTLYLPDYYLAKTPVTNAQYAAFVKATNHERPEHWKDGKPPKGKEDHPVVEVTWHDAVAYCNWLGQVTGKAYRLPSEAEWEKGARGTDGQIYPWGNEWDPKRCNSFEGGLKEITPVGAYPEGASPYGLLDMAGNVWEWCHSRYKSYPYNPKDGREDPEASDPRVLRGGSFYDIGRGVRCAYRHRRTPNYGYYYYGFRICVAPGFASGL